jgi:zinc transport system substrate-binding protein
MQNLIRASTACAACALCLVAVCGCGRAPAPPRASGALKVFVTIAPFAWAVERVAGTSVEVARLVQGGQSHESFTPTWRQVAQLTEADVWFRSGLPFEKALAERIASTAPRLRIVDVTQGVEARRGEAHGHEGEEHAGEGFDIHVWLDPRNMKIHARVICDELCARMPARAGELRAGYAGLAAELDAVDARIAAVLAPVKGAAVYVFHPAFGYFADRYGLTQRAIEVEGKEPTPRQLADLVAQARADGARTVFVQAQFPVRGASRVAEAIGADVAELDPTAYDYIANLERMAALLAEKLAPRT